MKKAKKLSLAFFKGLSALCLAYVLALVGRELISYGLFSFVFLILSISLAFLYLVRGYGFFLVLILDIFLVILAFLLRFYAAMAYGS